MRKTDEHRRRGRRVVLLLVLLACCAVGYILVSGRPMKGPSFMLLDTEEAVQGLRKWCRDKRVIHVSYADPDVDCSGWDRVAADKYAKEELPDPSLYQNISLPHFRLARVEGGMRGVGHPCPLVLVRADVSDAHFDEFLKYHLRYLRGGWVFRDFGVISYRASDETRARIRTLVVEMLRRYMEDLQALSQRYPGLREIGPEHLGQEKPALEYRYQWTKSQRADAKGERLPCFVAVNVEDLTRVKYEEWSCGPFRTYKHLGIEVTLRLVYDGIANNSSRGKDSAVIKEAVELLRQRLKPLEELEESLSR